MANRDAFHDHHSARADRGRASPVEDLAREGEPCPVPAGETRGPSPDPAEGRRRAPASEVLQSILQQHVWVRRVLTKAGTVAMSRLEGRATAGAVAEAVAELRQAILAHLAFEEGALLPILGDDLPLGPDRARRLIDEHTRQRAMLDALAGEASAQPHLPTLAAKLASLSSWLFADMAEEEGSLLVPDVVRDDQIVIDQSCG